jgi:hypothetical protein
LSPSGLGEALGGVVRDGSLDARLLVGFGYGLGRRLGIARLGSLEGRLGGLGLGGLSLAHGSKGGFGARGRLGDGSTHLAPDGHLPRSLNLFGEVFGLLLEAEHGLRRLLEGRPDEFRRDGRDGWFGSDGSSERRERRRSDGLGPQFERASVYDRSLRGGRRRGRRW